MKVFVLISTWEIGYANNSNARVFLTMEKAQKTMQEELKETIQDWNFDMNFDDDEHYCDVTDTSAILCDDDDWMNWHIEEKEIEE